MHLIIQGISHVSGWMGIVGDFSLINPYGVRVKGFLLWSLCQGCSLRLTGTRGLVEEGGVEGVVNAFRS